MSLYTCNLIIAVTVLLHPKQPAGLKSNSACRLIIRAISVLEGIALVANPEFAIVDESFPFVAKKMLTDQSPRLQAALQYMVRFLLQRKDGYASVGICVSSKLKVLADSYQISLRTAILPQWCLQAITD